ncbi:MAG: tRNA lysidine(34) synthetase TilS, partial [Candidatus Margulisbacteria bacterium]|nr:tRNA lysidine(34) synthetase TilS [Candidatus Margulisiibacteriota bacterium]
MLVSFSGGADSVYLMIQLLKKMDASQITLLYFDHGLRPESKDEISFSKQFSDTHKVPLIIQELDVLGYSKQQNCSLETAGRQMRYSSIIEKAKALQIPIVMTAHHGDDHCESMLMKLIRGSGTHWGGIEAVFNLDDIHVVRPLLGVLKTDIVQYLKCNDISFCTDESNNNLTFTRNRVRHSIMPHVRAINPKYDESFHKLSAYFSEMRHYVDTVLEPVLKCVYQHQTYLEIPRNILKELPMFLRNEAIYRLIRIFRGF